MRATIPFTLLFLLFAAYGQMDSPVPYCTQCDGSGPTFSIRRFRQSYIGVYSSIRNVDFQKIQTETHRNRRQHDNDPGDHYSEKQVSVQYLGGDSALVLNFWSDGGGSSTQGMLAAVFNLSRRHLKSVQSIAWDTHFEAGGPTESFDPKTNTLVVRSAHYIPGDAHCCVSAMDVVTLRWDGKHFIRPLFRPNCRPTARARERTCLTE
jgi:hypothetical protein